MTLIKGHYKGTDTANIGQAGHTRNQRQGADDASGEIIDKRLQHNTSECKTLMFCLTSLLIHYWYSSVGNHVRAFCFILQLQLLRCQSRKLCAWTHGHNFRLPQSEFGILSYWACWDSSVFSRHTSQVCICLLLHHESTNPSISISCFFASMSFLKSH